MTQIPPVKVSDSEDNTCMADQHRSRDLQLMTSPNRVKSHPHVNQLQSQIHSRQQFGQLALSILVFLGSEEHFMSEMHVAWENKVKEQTVTRIHKDECQSISHAMVVFSGT